MQNMSLVPIITSDKPFFGEIAKIFCDYDPEAEPIHLENLSQALEYLRIEMSELVVVNFSDEKINTDLLIAEIKGDTWLLNSGIIGLCESPKALHDSEKVRGTNIVALISIARLHQQFPKIINIISHNRHILFQRIIGDDLGNNILGSFFLNNDPLEASCFSNLICNFLFNINRLDAGRKGDLNFILNELLLNAIEHGNCGISYDEKTQWLSEDGDILKLIEKKCADVNIASRKVEFEYAIHPDFSTFKIVDEGDGFNWRLAREQDSPEAAWEAHGRGIHLSRGMTRSMTYNEIGNSVQFDFVHQTGISNVTPALFKQLETIDFAAGDFVFRQGEPSNFLYYIARGSFEVLIQDSRVSLLTPDDIFLGEMSFLLNNRRSATVRAVTNGCLIRISKKEFVEAIKEKPHYSLFLSRLLAKRIERFNRFLEHHQI